MDMIKRVNPIVVLVVGLVLGLLLGMALFWGPFPVQWENARPYDLEPEARAEYVALVADLYRLTADRDRVEASLAGWTDEEMHDAIEAAKEVHPDSTLALEYLQTLLNLGTRQVEQPSSLVDRLQVPCLVFVIVLLILVLAWIGFRVASRRRLTAPEDEPIRAQPVVPSEPLRQDRDTGFLGKAALGHFSTTYKLGEDTYDESFSIETPTGEFLGECGIGISEVIGASIPDKVTAFEVWLFDKSDIRTVTKVLMSEHAFHDAQLRNRLVSKGEAVLAQLDEPVVLNTTGLQIQVNVTELEYGDEDPSPDSYFSKLTIELVARARSTESDTSSFEETLDLD
jgi:hypothetical protein